ncbi:hypothetical protein SLH49_01780 [Cognatiyoonia sp. IB215446]|uniref:hypothetical protein n=1 Tax=Cognatiyoonia sp. IB215446 TaxID=3097355 RepID=UPI002A146C9D|nr:hypothetical protein [Cognatiyoonia sp. IB215446]MDX8346703.1 hypothetical protein [Cognatiyoonia sp. IB215446]
MDRRAFLIGLPLALSGCTGQPVWAPDDVIERAIYRDPGPKHLTLYTMRNVRSDGGEHSALLINASQRVIFDPAGAWKQDRMPERNDVLFGASPQLEDYYVSFHARITYYVVGRKVPVAPEVAEKALNLALVAGPVGQANCARYTSRIVRQLPGFESVRQTWWPGKLDNDFGRLPGVETTEYREDDDDDKSVAAREIDAALRAGQ